MTTISNKESIVVTKEILLMVIPMTKVVTQENHSLF
jgi:hypothetical protein